MSFEKWNPKDYLSQYYLTEKIAEDELHILKFCIEFLKSGEHHFTEVLDVGTGPTIHHAVPFAPHVDSIYLSDYLASNLTEIRNWIERHPQAHDWDPYLAGTLELEGRQVTDADTEERANLLRQKIKELLPCDIFKSDPIESDKKFPLVTSFYCADSATHSKEAWVLAMENILSMVAPGGWFIMSALEKAKSYKVESLEFPSAEVNKFDVQKVLEISDFKPDSIVVKVVPIQVWKNEGFDGIIIARAQKR